MQSLFLGLDGGGTKTEAMLCDASGRILARTIGGASSISGQSVDEAGANIRNTVNAVLQPFDKPEYCLEGFYAGISGCGIAEIRNKLIKCFQPFLNNVHRFELGSDARSALSSGIGLSDGVVAIAGTGSSVCSRKSGLLKRFGGWGYLLGDEGSGFDLGRKALVCALHGLDGSGPETLLLQKCEEQMSMPVDEFVSTLYRGDAKKEIASFARVLLDAAQTGDEVACAALAESLSQWAATIREALAYCGGHRVVAGGSLWKNDFYKKNVHALLPTACEIILPDLPPAFGSVVEAMGIAGFHPTDECFANARKTLDTPNTSAI